jgi:hypothetical protein
MEKVELIDVDLVADIDALAHGQALHLRAHHVKHDSAGEDPGLGEERYAAALPARKIHEAPHHADLGIDHADGIGTGKEEPALARDRTQPLLVGAAFVARLGEPGGDDARGTRAGLDALLHGGFDVLLGEHDVDEVDLLRDLGESRIGLAPHDLRGGAVDGIERAVEFALHQVVEQNAPRFARVGRGADHRDRARRNKRRDISHSVSPW